MTLPGPCLVEAVNTNKMIFIRSGANVNDGSAQQEVFLADADGSLDRDVPMQWDFEKVTSLTAYPLDADTLTVKGGVFETRANVAESKYNYYTRGFIISRANVRIEGMRHEITGELDHGAPYTGFLSFSRCAHATVTNCVFTAHKSYATIGSAGTSVTMGSYDVNVGSSIDVRLLDCRQTTDLRDSGYWGVYTSNFSKNLLLDGCSLSRFDAHQGVANATVRNSVIGYMGLKAVGCGTFLVENTEVLANYLFELRGDYGSPWEGEFVIRNCRIVPNVQKVVRVVHGSNNGQHDFGYPCSMPWRITIEGLEIADAGRPANIGGPYLFSDFNAANTSAAYFEPYPYKVTEEVVLRDVRIASGRTLQVSPNKWMFRNLRKTDTLPADLDCAICGIATGWNWTNLTVAAEVRALDLAAVRNGRLVLTVTDTAGRTVAREERPMTGTGAVDFAVALPEGGRNYLYELSAYDGETRLTYVTGDRAAERFCGAPQGGAWFAATAKGGVAQAVNGRWSGAPPETTGDAFRVSEPVEFAVTDREPGRNRSTCVELDYEVDDFVCPGVLSTDAAMTAFAACGDETAQDWRAVRRTATGQREWFVLHGRRPEAGVRYRVRIETDFTVVPARIRYSVRDAGETAFTVLTDGEGRAWHASGTDAATLGQVRFLGCGRTADLRGSVGDAAVAETGGVRYGDLNEALAAGAANGTAVTLLADVAFQPDRATGAAEVRLAGHRFKWRDGDRYALVHDPATHSFRGVRIDGTTANGLGGYASYALGLDATDPAARPRAGIVADGGTFRIALDVNPPANTGARIRYRLVESARPDFQESTTGAAQDAPEFRVPVGDGGRFYRILIDVAAPQ